MTWIWSPSPFVEGPAAMYVHWRPVFLQHLAAAWSALIKFNKTCLKWPLKKTKIGFTNRLLLRFNAGQKYCRMFQGDYSAILLTFVELPFAIKTFFVYFEWSFKTGFTVFTHYHTHALISHMSQSMRFPTMLYVRPAKPQISLRIHAVWSEPLLVAWVFYDC